MRNEDSAETLALTATIVQLQSDMQSMDGGSAEYAKAMNHLKELKKMQNDQPKSFWSRIDPNTMVIAGANLAGLLLVVGYERVHVIGGKAIGLAGKLR